MGFRHSGDTVITDSLSSHKVDGVAEAITGTGAMLRCLPTYNPDLNPIEMMRSKVKAYLRKKGARTKQILESALAEALDTVTGSDIAGWSKDCGYGIQYVDLL